MLHVVESIDSCRLGLSSEMMEHLIRSLDLAERRASNRRSVTNHQCCHWRLDIDASKCLTCFESDMQLFPNAQSEPRFATERCSCQCGISG